MRVRSILGVGLTLGLVLLVAGVAAAADDNASPPAATTIDDARSPATAKDKAAALRAALSRSQEGLYEVYLSDGTVALDLQGRFQVMMKATMHPDGTVTYECTTDPDSVLAPQSDAASKRSVKKHKQPASPLLTE